MLHLGSDYQKRRFKQQPGTSGHILDTRFWRYCRHPRDDSKRRTKCLVPFII